MLSFCMYMIETDRWTEKAGIFSEFWMLNYQYSSLGSSVTRHTDRKPADT